jgi:undecaprenyl-diphosphatase
MLLTASLLQQLDARDRALFLRCTFLTTSSRASRWFWLLLTHAGGAVCTIAAVLVPLMVGGPLVPAARHALATLVLSHVLVQMVKRTVVRPRPSHGTSVESLVAAPDRFAFPSGHSAAAMSVAIAYAVAYPALAAPLLLLAALVGMSRVFLGVHYPGDVLVGQLLAALTYLALPARL